LIGVDFWLARRNYAPVGATRPWPTSGRWSRTSGELEIRIEAPDPVGRAPLVEQGRCSGPGCSRPS